MGKLRRATVLVALAVLSCLAGTEVDAKARRNRRQTIPRTVYPWEKAKLFSAGNPEPASRTTNGQTYLAKSEELFYPEVYVPLFPTLVESPPLYSNWDQQWQGYQKTQQGLQPPKRPPQGPYPPQPPYGLYPPQPPYGPYPPQPPYGPYPPQPPVVAPQPPVIAPQPPYGPYPPQPPVVAPQPPVVAPQPPVVAPQPPYGPYPPQPPVVAPQPPVVAPQPPVVAPQPPVVAPPPPVVSPQPPVIAPPPPYGPYPPQPPVVAPQPPVVAPQPPVVAPQPPVVAPQPPVIAPQPPYGPSPPQPPVVTPQPPVIAPQPPVIAPQPPVIAPQPPVVVPQPPVVAPQPPVIAPPPPYGPYPPQPPYGPYPPQPPYGPYPPQPPYGPYPPQPPFVTPQPPVIAPQPPVIVPSPTIIAPSPTIPPPQQPNVQSCDVVQKLRVPCGVPGITADACSAISCCFDGQQCYYGKAVTVQCTKDAQFIVVVARDATLPNINLETISLLEEGAGCTNVDSNLGFAIYQFPVTACGTTVTEEPGIITYVNRMSSSFDVGVGPYGSITRDTTYQLIFQCRYIGSAVETLIAEVTPSNDRPLPVAALGPITVQLRLGNGHCTTKGCNEVDVAYNSFYADTDYPITKVLRDPVYVEVQLTQKTDPNLILTLGRCWTTTTPIPHSLPQWDILINGCPYKNDQYLSTLVPVGPYSGVDFPTHYRRFIFQMFTFVDPTSAVPLQENVYIHCSTAVCTAGPGSSCEPTCARKKRHLNDDKQKKLQPNVVVSVGPMIMAASKE